MISCKYCPWTYIDEYLKSFITLTPKQLKLQSSIFYSFRECAELMKWCDVMQCRDEDLHKRWICQTNQFISLTCKYYIILEMPGRNKHSSLLGLFAKFRRKWSVVNMVPEHLLTYIEKVLLNWHPCNWNYSLVFFIVSKNALNKFYDVM